MRDDRGNVLLGSIILSGMALLFNGGWILAIVIWAIYLCDCTNGEIKNKEEQEYRIRQEEFYKNQIKYSLNDHESWALTRQIMNDLMDKKEYSADHCQKIAHSIVKRYCPIYMSEYCLILEKQIPGVPVSVIKELGIQLVKQKYFEDVEKNKKIMYSPESPYPGESEI